MAFDSLVRLRQVNNPEFSGFVEAIIGKRISGFVLTGTGVLTGAFYPLLTNPSGYITGVQTGNFVTNETLAINEANTLATASGLYYLKNNPSGFITQSAANTGFVHVYPYYNTGVEFRDSASSTIVFSFINGKQFYIQSHQGASIIDVSGTNYLGNPTISGFAIHSTGIKVNGKDVLTDSGAWISTVNDSTNTRLYLYDNIIANDPFAFKQNSNFWLKGYNNNSIIDLYDSTRGGNKAYISGFEVYANKILISGVPVATGDVLSLFNTFTGSVTGNVTFAQLTGASGKLTAVDQTIIANLATTGQTLQALITQSTGQPVTSPKIFYLTKDYLSYSGRGYSAYSGIAPLIQYITGNSITGSLIYVGTGYFGQKTIGASNFGNLNFYGLYNQPQVKQIDFTFTNSTGSVYTTNGINIDYTVGTGAYINHKNYNGYSASTIQSISLGTGVFDGLDNLSITGSSSNGNLTVKNSNIVSLAVGNYQSFIADNCIVNNVSNNTDMSSNRLSFTKCIISGSTQLAPTSGNLPFLHFNSGGNNFTYSRAFIITGGGALGFDAQSLWLIKNNTGNLSTSLVLTKESGDALYYGIANPLNYATQNWVTTFYVQKTDAAYINNETHNDSFYLYWTQDDLNTLVFNEDSFYLRGTGGPSQGIIDFNGTNHPLGLHYISGLYIFSPSIVAGALSFPSDTTYVDGILLRNYITGIFNIQSGAQVLPFVFGTYNLPTGEVSTGFIPFGYTFSGTPQVIGNFINNSGDPIVVCQISGITTSGFYLNCSDTLLTTNYYFDYMATTGNSYVTLFNGIVTSLYQNTGLLTGQFYPLYSNPSGYVMSGQTGFFASTSNLSSTGSNLQNQIITIGNWTGITTNLYYPRTSNPSGYLTSVTISNAVTGITVSGSIPITGLVTLTGIGGLNVILSGNVVNFSGGAGNAANTGALINEFYPLNSNPSGYLTIQNYNDQVYLQTRYLV